jgi:hypothetical protein
VQRTSVLDDGEQTFVQLVFPFHRPPRPQQRHGAFDLL